MEQDPCQNPETGPDPFNPLKNGNFSDFDEELLLKLWKLKKRGGKALVAGPLTQELFCGFPLTMLAYIISSSLQVEKTIKFCDLYNLFIFVSLLKKMLTLNAFDKAVSCLFLAITSALRALQKSTKYRKLFNAQFLLKLSF